MNKTDGNTRAPLGVLAEITGLLAAITPEQFVVPQKSREEEGHVVATATDEIKKLFTLRDRLTNKCNDLLASLSQTSTDMLRYVVEKGELQIKKELETPGTRAFAINAKMDEFIAELQRAKNLREIVDSVFWLEVRNQHPDLVNKSIIGIRSDWSLTWVEPKEDDEPQISFHLVGASSLEGLAEMLGHRHDLH